MPSRVSINFDPSWRVILAFVASLVLFVDGAQLLFGLHAFYYAVVDYSSFLLTVVPLLILEGWAVRHSADSAWGKAILGLTLFGSLPLIYGADRIFVLYVAVSWILSTGLLALNAIALGRWTRATALSLFVEMRWHLWLAVLAVLPWLGCAIALLSNEMEYAHKGIEDLTNLWLLGIALSVITAGVEIIRYRKTRQPSRLLGATFPLLAVLAIAAGLGIMLFLAWGYGATPMFFSVTWNLRAPSWRS